MTKNEFDFFTCLITGLGLGIVLTAMIVASLDRMTSPREPGPTRTYDEADFLYSPSLISEGEHPRFDSTHRRSW